MREIVRELLANHEAYSIATLDLSGADPVATPFSHSAHGSSDVASLTGVSGYVVLRRGPVPDSLTVYLTES